MRHGGEEVGLGAGDGIGLGLGPAELLLDLDARGDVGLDGDKVLDIALVTEDGLHVEVDVEAAVFGGELDGVGGDRLARSEGGADPVDGPGVGFRARQQSDQGVAVDLGEFATRQAGVTGVGPLDVSKGVGDDDGVVGLAGDEGEFAALGLADAEGLVGAFAGVDVLDGAEDAAGCLRGGEGSAFGPQGDPERLAGLMHHAVFDLDERRLAAEVGVDYRTNGGLVLAVEEAEPALSGGRHLRGIVTDELPDAGRAIHLIGFHIPLVNAGLGGVEGEVEALVGGLEPVLDVAAFLIFLAQLAAGELGGALAEAGRLGEVDDKTEEQADPEAGSERDLGQVLPVGGDEDRARVQRDVQPLVENAVGGGLAEAMVE